MLRDRVERCGQPEYKSSIFAHLKNKSQIFAHLKNKSQIFAHLKNKSQLFAVLGPKKFAPLKYKA